MAKKQESKRAARPGKSAFDEGAARAAADGGSAQAQYDLARCLIKGDEGVARNEAEAVRYYRLAADQGHPQAQNNLAVCLQDGIGGEEG
jgi:TPR repeat protein